MSGTTGQLTPEAIANLPREKREEMLRLYQQKQRREKEEGQRYFEPCGGQVAIENALEENPDLDGLIIIGGNQCIGAETEIYDPVSGESKRVEDIRKPFYVYAWDGIKLVIAKALAPFEKAVDDLFEITLSNGRRFVSSGNHLVLTPDGYCTISELPEGSSLFLPESISGTVRPVLSSNGHRSLRTIQDYQSRCSTYLYQCDVRPHRVVNIGQDDSPLPGGVSRCSLNIFAYSDDLGNKPSHNHPCRSSGRPSSMNVLVPEDNQLVDTLSHASCRPCKSVFRQPQAVCQSSFETDPLRSIRGSCRPDNQYDCECPSLTSTLVITNIRHLRRDVVYDFMVPGYHNYMVAGAIHHNSGKSMYSTSLITRTLARTGPLANRWQGPLFVRDVVTEFSAGYENLVNNAYSGYRSMIRRDLLKFNDWDKAESGKPATRRVRLEDEGVIEIMSGEQDPLTFGGPARHIVRFEEWPKSKIVFDECMRRLARFNGLWIVAGTMVKGRRHWARDLIKKVQYGARPNIKLFKLDARENPHINQDRLKRDMEDMTDSEIRMRVAGEVVELGDRLLPDFNIIDNVVPKFPIPNEWPKIIACDVHDHKPNYILWGAIEIIRDRAFLHLWKEASCLGTAEKTNELCLYGSEGRRIDKWLIERSVKKFDHNTNQSQWDLFTKGQGGIREWQKWDGQAEDRMNLLKSFCSLLPVSEEYVSPETGKRYTSRLLIHDNLEDTIDEMENVSFKAEARADANYSERRHKVDDDYYDCSGAIAQWAQNYQNLITRRSSALSETSFAGDERYETSATGR